MGQAGSGGDSVLQIETCLRGMIDKKCYNSTLMPIEVYEGKIDFAEGRNQLQKTRLFLARLEGVEPSDDSTRSALAQEAGLPDGSIEEGKSFAEKIIIKGLAKAVIALLGDGSVAAQLVGRRVELPTEDRGLFVLATLLDDHSVKRNERWPTAALLSAASQRGVVFGDIEKRVKGGISGIASIANRFSGSQGDSGESEIGEFIDGLKQIWGNSPEDLAANKLKFETGVRTSLEGKLKARPRRAGEVRQDLSEMTALSGGSLQRAVVNAQGRLGKIVETNRESFDVQPERSILGKYLLFDKIRREVGDVVIPEQRNEVMGLVVASALGLKAINFEELTDGDEVTTEQITNRVKILRGADSMIKSPADLLQAGAARRKEVTTIKKLNKDLSNEDRELPYYDPRPEAVAGVISFLIEKELLDDDAKLGETFAAAWAIIQESRKMMEEARGQAEPILEGLAASKDSPRYAKSDLGLDKVALGLLELVRPNLPDTTVVVPEKTRKILERIVRDIPDFWTINSLAQSTLGEIFSGERLPKGETLEKEFEVFSTLLMANLASE